MTAKNETFRTMADENEIASEFEEIFKNASVAQAMPTREESEETWRKIEEWEARQ